MDIVFIILAAVFVLYFLIMVPVQYRYIDEMKKSREKANQTQNEQYESMSFQEEQLHFNQQGNLLNLPSALVATIIYKIRNRNKH
ncbi:DUF3949 domain-containing protein [Fredinandcohnia sp. 179-A 10B2 NHS]|uniref:DUF3949 domain-containing protein n=1 Tax=Fredinandcohnia sp. 179-A 10B2 NHS TaxID=3235176 RepID=UPI00399F9FDA